MLFEKKSCFEISWLVYGFLAFCLLSLFQGCKGDDDYSVIVPEEEEMEEETVPSFSDHWTVAGYFVEGASIDVDQTTGEIYIAGYRYQNRSETELVLGKFDSEGNQLSGAFYTTEYPVVNIPDLKVGGNGSFYVLTNEAVANSFFSSTTRWTLNKYFSGQLEIIWSRIKTPPNPGFPDWESDEGYLIYTNQNATSSNAPVYVVSTSKRYYTIANLDGYITTGDRVIESAELSGMTHPHSIGLTDQGIRISGSTELFTDGENTKIIETSYFGTPRSDLTINGVAGGVMVPAILDYLVVGKGEALNFQNELRYQYVRNGSVEGTWSVFDESLSVIHEIYPLDENESFIVRGRQGGYPWLAHYENGELKWQQSYQEERSYIKDVSIHPDGGLVIVGFGYNENNDPVHIWIMKTDQFGRVNE